MKTALVVVAALAPSPAFADGRPDAGTTRRLTEIPRVVPGETIIIHGTAPPARLPKAKKSYGRIAPQYSDWMMEHDVWAKAWLLLDIDEHGVVTRVKLLKKPGYDLDQIAIDRGFSMRFDPAEDINGNPMRTELVTPIEWPAFWWLITREGLATKIPDYIDKVPCAGTGPWKMGSIHKAYRDCSPPPDLSKLDAFPWIEKH